MAPAAFDDFENVNLAGKAEWAELQAEMAAQLQFEVGRWQTPNPQVQAQATEQILSARCNKC
jgi:hypothetical protein